MLLLAILLSCCLLNVTATGKCQRLPAPKWQKQYPEPPGGTRGVKTGSSGSQTTFYCDSGYYPFGRLSTIKNTPLFMEFIEDVPQYTCNLSTGVWTPETKLTDMTCAKPPTASSNCALSMAGVTYRLFGNVGAVQCNYGLQMRDPLTREAIKDIKCKDSKWTVTFTNNRAVTTPLIAIECIDPSAATTTTTLAPTTTTTTSIQCPLPKDVPATDYPSPWINGGSMNKTSDGKNDWISCRQGFIGKLTSGSKAFSLGGEYMCDTNTKRWIRPDSKYTAPEFMSCGSVDPTKPLIFCPINHTQTDGKEESIALYPGYEEFCRPEEIPLFVQNGRAIKQLTCSGNGLLIVTDDDVKHNDWHPTLQCFPGSISTTTSSTAVPTTTTPKPVCAKPSPITSDPPSPWEIEGDIRISANGRRLYCPSMTLGQIGDGASVHTFGYEYYCNETSNTWQNQGYVAPAHMSCAKNLNNLPSNCVVNNVQTSGVGGHIAIYKGKEQFCPTGQEVQYANGSRIMSIACNDGLTTIIDGEGNEARVPNPKLKCAEATCPIPLRVSAIPDPFDYDGVPKINGHSLSCQNYIIGQIGKDANPHSVGDTFYCNEITNTWELNGYTAPSYMSCGILNNVIPLNHCGVYYVQAEFAMLPIAIYPGKEQFCPIGQAVKIYRGDKITNITCSSGTISIDDKVWTEAKSPVLECV